MDRLRTDVIRPDQLAVVLDGRPDGLPRPDGWEPTAPLRLDVRPRSGADNGALRWARASRHRTEDAATADIRPAKLRRPDGELRVVLKMRRIDPALNPSDEAIVARFDREQRSLRDLARDLPDAA